ncbi:metallophosphoesterase [Paenibacillus sp. CAU 1782]
MNIRTNVHTIFMMVGATECGKSTFASKVLIPQLQLENKELGLRANVQYLSSDGIRQELLGGDYDKYDQVMLEASAPAFQLLLEKLKLLTSFPVNAEFVVVDTTGLMEDFRSQVSAIAKENNYRLEVILFDYRKREDYYASDRSKAVISSHLNRLRKEVLPVLSREGYDKVHKVRAKDFCLTPGMERNPEYTVTVEDWETYESCVLPRDRDYVVIGDVHECVDELTELLEGYGFRTGADGVLTVDEKARNTTPVLVGDWIDKGGQTREIIDFLYLNKEHFRLIVGNHENFVHKYAKGEIAGVGSELPENFFTSVQELSGDDELFRKFAELVEMSRPFYRMIGQNGPSFYVTHAPCRNKYIGKLGTEALRQQRNFRLDREAPVEEQLAFLEEDAVRNYPYHLFGHIAAGSRFMIGNKVHLDTGCVHGNALTAVRMSSRLQFKSCKARKVSFREPLPELFREEKKVALVELDNDSLKRLRYSARNGINYISGTMSPADKDEAAGELESLAKGLAYFAAKGANKIVLQPKYMGSRCNIYLSRDPEQCYAVSRNGYKVKGVELGPVYGELLNRFGPYMEKEGVALMLLDGELLPWRALGDALIRRQFEPIGKALEAEISFLRDNGFQQAWSDLVEKLESSGFEQEQNRLAKGVLSDKYGAHVYQTFKHAAIAKKSMVPLQQQDEALQVYLRQLDLYGGEGDLSYKPFALLKEVLENGEERLPQQNTSDMYSFLNDDDMLVLDLTEPDALERAEAFFAKLTVENGMEGVVIKPERQARNAVPYLKVRNPGYLSIIYGYDYRFSHKYSKLIKQKNITPKLRASINEQRLGEQLLAVKLAEVGPENEAYNQIAANLLFEVARESEIDPRL